MTLTIDHDPDMFKMNQAAKIYVKVKVHVVL